MFYSRAFDHVLRPGPSPNLPPDSTNLDTTVYYLEVQLRNYLAEKKTAWKNLIHRHQLPVFKDSRRETS